MKFSAPSPAMSVEPDAEGHKQNRNENNSITKISRLGKIPTVDPVSGDFRPQDGFLSFEKVAKK